MSGEETSQAQDLATACQSLRRNMQLSILILDIYSDEKFWDDTLTGKKGGDVLSVLTAAVFAATLTQEIDQARELAMVLAASCKIYLSEEQADELIEKGKELVAAFPMESDPS